MAALGAGARMLAGAVAAVALCAATVAVEGGARAAASLSLTGPITLTMAGEQLVLERVGSFPWGKATATPAALGTAAVFRLPPGADCTTKEWSGRPESLEGRVVLLDASTDCDSMLPLLQLELQALGASAVLMAAQTCLCSESALLPSGYAFCSNRPCAERLGPRTPSAKAAERDLLRVPVAVISRLLFERAAACVAGSDSTELGLGAGACRGGAGAQLKFQLGWAPGLVSARPALHLYTSVGELYSPFKTVLFTDTLLPQLWSSNATLDVVPLVLNGAKMSMLDSTTGKQVPVNCTAQVNATTYCTDNCDPQGRYCARPSMQSTGRNGRAVLRENVRQACMLSATRDGTPGRLAFFAYAAQFRTDCEKRLGIGKLCSQQVHDRLGLDFNATIACAEGPQGEALLAALAVSPSELEAQGVVQQPTLAAQSSVVPLGLAWGNLFQGMCAAFAAGPSRPAFCSCLWTEENRALVSIPEDKLLDKCFGTAQGAPPAKSTSYVWLAVLLAVVGGALLALCSVCLWRLRKGKRAHVTMYDSPQGDSAETNIQLSEV